MANERLSDQDILQRFRDIVAASLRIDPAAVTPDVYLDELGAESLDLLEVSLEVEDAFHILLPETNILDAATAVFGAGVLHKDGVLTDEGVRLLESRMPEFQASDHSGPIPMADVRRAFLRVSAWVRLIRFLVDRRPQECPTCGVALVGGTPGRLKCEVCATEYDIPLGDAVNKAWIDEYRRVHTPLADESTTSRTPSPAEA